MAAVTLARPAKWDPSLRVATVGLADYFPWYAWAAVLTLVAVAAVGLFVPPSASASLGLSTVQHIAVVAGVELFAAVGIAATVLYYRQPPEAESEAESGEQWRFDP